MRVIKVLVKDAEKTKQHLIKRKNLSFTHKVVVKQKYAYFPVNDLDKVPDKYTLVSMELPTKRKKDLTLREKVLPLLTEEEQKELKTAFDQVGTIAILEVEDVLRNKQKKIAQALLEVNPQIKTVLRKVGSHSGVFRTQKMQFLAGVDTRVAEYKELGVTLFLDVEHVYFSPRLSTERKRVMQLVKKGEAVLVMFSGCAPYPCVLSKNTSAKEIYGVEINPTGHEYGLKNVAKNKLKNIRLFNGDVRDVVPALEKKFDRIFMPLPKSAEDFLDVALGAIKKGGMIHFYDFLHENDFGLALEKIKKACTQARKKCKILRTVKCGQYSPRTYRICVDFIVL